jgi:hypothetical protein
VSALPLARIDAAGSAAAPSASSAPDVPPSWLRYAVRDLLVRSPAFGAMREPERRALAQAMVKVGSVAAALIAEEGDAHASIVAMRDRARAGETRDRPRPDRRAPLARAQDAPGFGASAERIAGTTRAVLDAVSFPRFVTDLINGVFRAMLDSSAQQMQMYVQLLNNVSASAEGFERTQYNKSGVRQWIADHFPDQIEYDLPETSPDDDPPDPEDVAEIRLRLKSNASMPGPEELRAVLGMEPGESADASNPEQLVPLARRQIARQRQQMLATMVMLGMQRIVVDSGKINASMRFHIDTRSAAEDTQGSEFSLQNRIKASGKFGVGPWGASAEVENNISYVSTQRSQSTEQINTDLDLASSVEINFRTDYLPLNQMAAQAQADRIRQATLNPSALPADTGDAARQARLNAQVQAENAARAARDASLDRAVGSASGSAGSPLASAGANSASAATPSASRGSGAPPTRPPSSGVQTRAPIASAST